MSDAIKDINADEYADILTEPGVKVVDFWAPWCGPCKLLLPKLVALAEKRPNVSFYKVNADDNSDLLNEMGIRSVPTLLVIKDGDIVASLTTLNTLEAVLDKALI
jgi:thioredoxin 1